MVDEDVLRTFVGIPLTGEAQRAVIRMQEAFQSEYKGHRQIKWERTANLHITISFLGNTFTSDLKPIEEALHVAMLGFSPFFIKLGVPSFFGGKSPRVCVITVTEGGELLRRLQADVARELEHVGFPPEKREYKPHFTFGRVRRNRRIDRIEVERVGNRVAHLVQGVSFNIKELVHFKSELSPTGAHYTPLSTITLGVE